MRFERTYPNRIEELSAKVVNFNKSIGEIRIPQMRGFGFWVLGFREKEGDSEAVVPVKRGLPF